MFKRVQFIEIQDCSWLPSSIRDGVTDYLQFLLRVFSIYNPSQKIIYKILKNETDKKVIDLCSGSGGPIVNIANNLQSNQFFLSDLYPNYKSWEFIKKNNMNISYISESADATNLKTTPNSLYTMYTSFHHFNNQNAKAILQNITKNNCDIAIFEFVQRDLISLILVLPSPIFMFFLIPFVKPFKFSRIFFTYALPLIPFITFWDIIVTVLRIRTKDELLLLTKDITHYQFEYHEERTNLFLKMSAFYGVPKSEK